jgi:hypothetical protein
MYHSTFSTVGQENVCEKMHALNENLGYHITKTLAVTCCTYCSICKIWEATTCLACGYIGIDSELIDNSGVSSNKTTRRNRDIAIGWSEGQQVIRNGDAVN